MNPAGSNDGPRLMLSRPPPPLSAPTLAGVLYNLPDRRQRYLCRMHGCLADAKWRSAQHPELSPQGLVTPPWMGRRLTLPIVPSEAI